MYNNEKLSTWYVDSHINSFNMRILYRADLHQFTNFKIPKITYYVEHFIIVMLYVWIGITDTFRASSIYFMLIFCSLQAQNIKNFRSQRWQTLLNFSSQRRLLLTGTPLQNSLMELWSLMHFLMPHVFQSHREFKEWFANPLTGMIEGSSEYNESIIMRLHKVSHYVYCLVNLSVRKMIAKFVQVALTFIYSNDENLIKTTDVSKYETLF